MRSVAWKWRIASAREEGAEPAEKYKQAPVMNTSMYIAMCAKCCSVLQIPFSVCYQEADAGLAARFLMNASQYIVVSADTDMLANGVSKWVSVKSWWTGEATFIDVTAEGLEAHVKHHGAAAEDEDEGNSDDE